MSAILMIISIEMIAFFSHFFFIILCWIELFIIRPNV